MSRIKCIIVDDERIAREGLEMLLQSDNEVEVVSICSGGLEAIEAIQNHKPDLLFLDIQMPGLNGFDVVSELDPENIPLIVFVTAYNQYAIDAFKVNAFNYILKPFEDEYFYEILEKCKRQIRLQKKDENIIKLEQLLEGVGQINKQASPKKFLDRILIKTDSGVQFVETTDITAIEAFDYYIKILTKTDRYIKRISLNAIEDQIDPNVFVRIHRSTIVNVSCIRSIEKYSKTEDRVILKDGNKYNLSRNGKKILKDKFLF